MPKSRDKLKPNLRGFFGGMIRAYLPQAWIFTTEAETVTLYVDAEGNVSVGGGRASSPDVIVQGTNAALGAALDTRKAAMVPPGSIKARPMTSKETWHSISSGIGLVSRIQGCGPGWRIAAALLRRESPALL